MWKARVIYDHNQDGYRIEINTGNGWGLDKFYPCIDDRVRYDFISHLAELDWLGYDITFRDL